MNRCGGLTETARRVAIEFLFVHHNDAHGGSFPSHGLLAERLGVTRPRISEACTKLVDQGWFTVRRRGRELSNLYSPNWARTAVHDVPASEHHAPYDVPMEEQQGNEDVPRAEHLNGDDVPQNASRCSANRTDDVPQTEHRTLLLNPVKNPNSPCRENWWNISTKVNLPPDAQLPPDLVEEALRDGLEHPAIAFARFVDFFTDGGGKSQKRTGERWRTRWRLWVAQDVIRQKTTNRRANGAWNRRALALDFDHE